MEKVFFLLFISFGIAFAGDCSKFKFSGQSRNQEMMGEYVRTSRTWYDRPVYEHKCNRVTYLMYHMYNEDKRPEWVIRYDSEAESDHDRPDQDHDRPYDHHHDHHDDRYRHMALARSLDSAEEPEKITAPWEERFIIGKRVKWAEIHDWKIECQGDEHEYLRKKTWLLALLLVAVVVIIVLLTVCGLRLYMKTRSLKKKSHSHSAVKAAGSPPAYVIDCQAEALPEKLKPDVVGFNNPSSACDVTDAPPNGLPLYEEVAKEN